MVVLLKNLMLKFKCKKKETNEFIYKGKKISKIVNTEIFILRQLLFKIRNNIDTIKKHIDANFETGAINIDLSSKYMNLAVR